MAQIGLVGFPNAGKSSLVASVSRALPKIANYPFTTIVPSIGHIRFIDDFTMTIADLPGIIEDASKNKGLGLSFLRHIERCAILCFVVDISGEDPVQELQILEQELKAYGGFEGKPKLLVANKSDCDQFAEEKFKHLQQYTEMECFLTSVKHHVGLGEVVLALRK